MIGSNNPKSSGDHALLNTVQGHSEISVSNLIDAFDKEQGVKSSPSLIEEIKKVAVPPEISPEIFFQSLETWYQVVMTEMNAVVESFGPKNSFISAIGPGSCESDLSHLGSAKSRFSRLFGYNSIAAVAAAVFHSRDGRGLAKFCGKTYEEVTKAITLAGYPTVLFMQTGLTIVEDVFEDHEKAKEAILSSLDRADLEAGNRELIKQSLLDNIVEIITPKEAVAAIKLVEEFKKGFLPRVAAQWQEILKKICAEKEHESPSQKSGPSTQYSFLQASKASPISRMIFNPNVPMSELDNFFESLARKQSEDIERYRVEIFNKGLHLMPWNKRGSEK